jgi:hypothetical protein
LTLSVSIGPEVLHCELVKCKDPKLQHVF